MTLSRVKDRAVIAVTDYGVGIPQDQLHSIFDPFVQLGETVHQSEGGLGVGLTLVRCLVDAHDGEVSAQSEGEGKGTTFHVSLPIAQPPNRLTVDVVSPDVSRRESPLTIVLIEDIDDNREMLASLLEIDGHKVHPYPDGESGTEAIAEHQPDYALVDIGLPGIDGYEVARRIRRNPACDSTKLIALTGFGQQSDVESAIAAGFDAHLVKPVDPDELAKTDESLTGTGRGVN